MHEVEGLFCKTGSLWIIGQIAAHRKKHMRAETEVNWAGWGCSHRAKAQGEQPRSAPPLFLFSSLLGHTVSAR